MDEQLISKVLLLNSYGYYFDKNKFKNSLGLEIDYDDIKAIPYEMLIKVLADINTKMKSLQDFKKVIMIECEELIKRGKKIL